MVEMNQVPNPPTYPQQQLALPNSTATLVLGIISIVCFCCCNFVGIALGIIGIVLGNKAVALYNQSPGVYTEASFKNANAGRICSIIGLVLCSLIIVGIIAFWAPYTALIKEFIETYSF